MGETKHVPARATIVIFDVAGPQRRFQHVPARGGIHVSVRRVVDGRAVMKAVRLLEDDRKNELIIMELLKAGQITEQ